MPDETIPDETMTDQATTDALEARLDALAGKRVVITGGLGFIGSSLALRLVEHGAEVTITDAMLPEYGGNLFNIEPVKDRVRVNFCDIRDVNSMNYLVRGQDVVFHLAGQNCHILSLRNPFPDIDMNIKGTAIVLEAMKAHAPDAVLVYSGTRGQYGKSVSLPVNEDAPTNPLGIYEVSRLAAEKMIQVYNDSHGIPAVMLRMTNIYGPRSQMLHNRFGVVNWFVRLVVDDQEISVFGDGSMLRDFLHIDDCVDAMLLCAVDKSAHGKVLNLGHHKPTSFLELVETMIDVAGTGSFKHTEFSKERAAQNPGHYYSDITRISEAIGWQPKVDLRAGLSQTVEYYRKHKAHYWE